MCYTTSLFLSLSVHVKYHHLLCAANNLLMGKGAADANTLGKRLPKYTSLSLSLQQFYKKDERRSKESKRRIYDRQNYHIWQTNFKKPNTIFFAFSPSSNVLYCIYPLKPWWTGLFIHLYTKYPRPLFLPSGDGLFGKLTDHIEKVVGGGWGMVSPNYASSASSTS